MLFEHRWIPQIIDGTITQTVRLWSRPQARAGGRYTLHGAGMIEATSVDQVPAGRLTKADATRCGFGSVDELRAAIERWSKASLHDETIVWRVRFRFLPPEEHPPAPPLPVTEVVGRLDRIDARSTDGSWTQRYLELIHRHPATRAGDLAEEVGAERDRFKQDVRKLKGLGLTISLSPGYRLSGLGEQVLALLRERREGGERG